MLDGTIDFHTHYIPEALTSFHADGCVRLEIDASSAGRLFDGDRLYRVIDDRCWSANRRISDMDARGIALQVLSPIPVTNSYEASSTAGTRFARLHNEQIASVVRMRPDRFAGLGAVPLQDVDAACAELEFLMRDLGLIGIEIGTTAGGRELDDPALLPFWEACNGRRAIVFLHPESAPGFERHRGNAIVPAAGYPSETGIVAAKLLMAGFLETFPDLRIVLAHGGGTLPWLLPRLDRFWTSMPSVRVALSEPPSKSARGFYCDTLTFDATNLAIVAERFGNEHLLVGSDYPFAVMEDPPGAVLDHSAFDATIRSAMRSRNFRALAAHVNGP